MTEPHPTEGEYTAVMPFILCQSEGGPYDDAAFIAGATCGALIEELRVLRLTTATPHERYMNAKYLPQIDLIAMANGYTIKPGELDQASGWQIITFEFAGDHR
jgi:hypothetical protein